MSEPQTDPQVERGIGDNSARVPLVDQISADLVEEKKRATELLTIAGTAKIRHATDAGKVADLILMMRILERQLEKKRDARKQPFQLDMRVVDSTFAALITQLTTARVGPGSLTEMLDIWKKANPGVMPITTIASVGERRRPQFHINDLAAATAWLVEHHPDQLLAAARTILGPIVRQAGVDDAGTLDIPGVSVDVETRAQVR